MTPAIQCILFLTSPEHGQSNVGLAVAEEFLRRGEYEVHIASFHPLAARVQAINNQADFDRVARFHTIAGPSMSELVARKTPNICHKPGIAGTLDGCEKINKSVLAWSPEEYLRSYRSCIDILKAVQPVVVVVDPLLHLGLDAARSAQMKIVILWPVPLKDVVIMIQPKLGILWKYPLTGSGYPFPLPWHLIFPNIYMVLCFGLIVRLGKPMRELLKCRKKAGVVTPFPHLLPYCAEHLHLSPCFPAMDFPLHVPGNVMSCGPILRPHSSLAANDPSLNAWLTVPTILICLGSHVQALENDAMQMVRAIQTVFSKYPDIHVLWKLRYDWETSPRVKAILGPLVYSDKVRIVSWIQPEIISLLESGHILAYVHHGGANSFFEACKGGIPQVVLPQWFDTYDCPSRVEWLGIGMHGSRNVAPKIGASELSSALLRVLKDKGIQSRARAIGDLCKATEGRVVAHDHIVQYSKKDIGAFGGFNRALKYGITA